MSVTKILLCGRYIMVWSHSEYYTTMSVSDLPTFLISVKNMNLLSSSIYKHLKTYLIKHKQSLILGEYFLSDPMSDRKKSFRQLCVIFTKKQHGARPCVEKMQLIFFVSPNEELEGTWVGKHFFSVWHWVRKEVGFCLTHGLCVCPTIFL
jgi:hypothetical protein